MASSASMVVMPLTCTAQNRLYNPISESFFKPLPLKLSKRSSSSVSCSKIKAKFEVQASFKEKAVTGLTAALLTASMVIPDVAEAAGPGVPPSLKNFLLSIVAGGVVLTAIIGAVVGVSNFDPVKRT